MPLRYFSHIHHCDVMLNLNIFLMVWYLDFFLIVSSIFIVIFRYLCLSHIVTVMFRYNILMFWHPHDAHSHREIILYFWEVRYHRESSFNVLMSSPPYYILMRWMFRYTDRGERSGHLLEEGHELLWHLANILEYNARDTDTRWGLRADDDEVR